jgi:outer membrane biosynthesis protein TonB
MNSELKSHLSAKSTWLRLLYMILFVVAFNLAGLVTAAVVIVQFLFKLFTGQANEQLQSFGHKLAIYFRQTVAFLAYDSEEMPFPFAAWPKGEAEPAWPATQAAPPPSAAEPAPEPPAAAQTAARPKPKAKSTKPKRARKKPETEPKPEAEAGPSEPSGQEPKS